MYYLSDSERKLLVRKYIPASRRAQISEEVRGWSWDRPPLEPPYENILLPMWEVCGKYCSTNRDLYLRHVEKIKVEPSESMQIGALYHSLLSTIYLKAKKFLYTKGVMEHLDLQEYLVKEIDVINELIKQRKLKEENVLKNCIILWKYEAKQIANAVENTLAKQPNIGVDSLVNTAIPVVVEQRLDGRFLGLSGQIAADAINAAETVVFDVKTGEQAEFHKLYTTGYALVYESLFEFPIGIGIISYLGFDPKLPVPKIKRDFHLIDEELRMWWIEERDQKMRIVAEEIDPGLCDQANKQCIYYPICFR
jgi:CRISPR-associated protein Csa1